MQAINHYRNHLGNFYSWMVGEFDEKQQEQEQFFIDNDIRPKGNKDAIDLGAGHGIQSVSLARIGFQVYAVDFNPQLLEELEQYAENLAIRVVESDLLHYIMSRNSKAGVIVCMGDTLTHLESVNDIDLLMQEISDHLDVAGKVVLSFRDLTTELNHERRFLPIKSSDDRILTCFLEYFPDHVMVHDILHEKQHGKWVQKVSAYPKIRISAATVTELLEKYGVRVVSMQIIDRMIYLIGEKVS